MKLYHYVHCPFCVRVRMGLGRLGVPYESQVLPYDDEQTPISLTGKKMLPILIDDHGAAINESLDILRGLDKTNMLRWERLEQQHGEIEGLLEEIGSNVHSLCMPYFIWTPEFNESSRQYFQKKKEAKRGPFNQLIQNKNQYLSALGKTLEEKLAPKLRPYYDGTELSILDIMIAAHLWGMYIFPEFQFSPQLNQYLQQVKADCHFDYHRDYWL